MSEFHYVWNAEIDPAHVREKYEVMPDGEPVKIQWTGGGGGSLEWSISELGLHRWKITVYSIADLETLERLLRDAFAPLAKHEVKLHPVYQEGGRIVGWVLWKPK
jgi:hypothetical protein